jgi:flagellar biogenesis protein FliO
MRFLQYSKETTARKASAPEVHGLAGWLLGLLPGGVGRHAAQVKQMQLIETLALGGKRQLMLVTCGEERFLVGGGLESVETIVQVNAESSFEVEKRISGVTCQ